MQAVEFWKAPVLDEANMLERLVTLFREREITFCVISGQAVNAYVEPLVSMDLDVVVAVADMDRYGSAREVRTLPATGCRGAQLARIR